MPEVRTVSTSVLEIAFEESGPPDDLQGVGHNVPQEAPDDFAAAVLDLLSL